MPLSLKSYDSCKSRHNTQKCLGCMHNFLHGCHHVFQGRGFMHVVADARLLLLTLE